MGNSTIFSGTDKKTKMTLERLQDSKKRRSSGPPKEGITYSYNVPLLDGKRAARMARTICYPGRSSSSRPVLSTIRLLGPGPATYATFYFISVPRAADWKAFVLLARNICSTLFYRYFQGFQGTVNRSCFEQILLVCLREFSKNVKDCGGYPSVAALPSRLLRGECFSSCSQRCRAVKG